MINKNAPKEGIENIIAEANKLAQETEAKRVLEKAEADRAATGEEPVKTVEQAATKTEEKVVPPAKEEPAKAEPTKDTAKLDTALDAIAEDDGDGEVKPDGKGEVKMPFKAFEKRIARAAKAHLKAIFGTDDREAVLKMKKDFDEMQSKREEERRSKLDEVQRLKEDKERAERRAKELEDAANAREEREQAEAEEKRVTTIASQFIDSESMELAHFKFAKHLKKKTEKELEDYSEDDVANWYKNWSEKNPKHAKKAAAEEKKVEEVKESPKASILRPLNVGGADPKKPSTKTADPQAKTPAPGKANSMSATEWAAYKRKNGISY